MINEQRWKTNYIGLLEAGNCFYENVNCVCQADTGSGGRGGARARRRRNRGAVDRTSTAPLDQIIGASSWVMASAAPRIRFKATIGP